MSYTPMPAKGIGATKTRISTCGLDAGAYDADGNTITDPSGNTYTYDTLDRMTSVSGTKSESFVYDGDGNKVSHTANGNTQSYLIDSRNLTGYAQVMDVLQSGGNVTKTYTYGTSRIAEDQLINSNWTMNYYGYDGQGSVRYLMDGNGNVTDTYTLDAFGNSISSTGSTPNVNQFDGEQLDPNTGFYNLRARWMNPGIGRFQTMDSYEGDSFDLKSLHKYSFVFNNPANLYDPSGRQISLPTMLTIGAILGMVYEFDKISWGLANGENYSGLQRFLMIANGAGWGGLIGSGAGWLMDVIGILPASITTTATATVPLIPQLNRANLLSNLQISEHALDRMNMAGSRGGVTIDMIRTAIAKAPAYWNDAEQTFNFLYKGGMASGKDLLVGVSPDAIVSTVIKGTVTATAEGKLIPIE